ncbi:MAG: tetratricopeptide repeat protein [Planctomycetaceae bacterium]
MIFINYRKSDTQGVVDHLAFRLKSQFGDEAVFKDDADLQGGERWPARLRDEISNRQVVLAVIGPDWLTAEDQSGNRRLDNCDDWVRQELCLAFDLDRDVLVLLVDGAKVPSKQDLPDSALRMLPEIQTLPLRTGRDFEADLERLAERLLQLTHSRLPGGGGKALGTPVDTSNLPFVGDSFIGRVEELRRLQQALTGSQQQSLVTVWGPPGSGKTRLAVQVARLISSRFSGGCWFADLSDCQSADDVAHAVAKAFSVPLTGKTSPTEEVARVLEYRKPMLLILDNFEQVAETAPDTIVYWRRVAPQVRFLTTSRTLLAIADEHEFMLDPLPIPEGNCQQFTEEELLNYGAIQLFVERASSVRPEFRLDDQNASDVVSICQRLDGVPLAIELAAARMRIFQTGQLLERLEKRFDILKSNRRDIHRRHQTLLAAIDWSFDLLQPWEQETLLQASIFRGGFFLSAAEEIIDLSASEGSPTVMDAVQSLCEKGLLVASDTIHGTRFRMLLTIREFGQSRIEQSWSPEKLSALWNAFTQSYLKYATNWNDRIHSESCRVALDRLELEIPNCLAAYDWQMDTEDFDNCALIILALGEVLTLRGPVHERIPRIEMCLQNVSALKKEYAGELAVVLVDAMHDIGEWERGIELAVRTQEELSHDANELMAQLLFIHSRMLCLRGSYLEAINGLREAQRRFEEFGDERRLSNCASQLGWAYMHIGEDDLALECYVSAERHGRTAGDPLAVAAAYNNRGVFHNDRRELDDALKHMKQAELMFAESGDRRSSALPISNQATVFQKRRQFDAAIVCCDKAEEINREFGNHYSLAANINNRAMANRSFGRLQVAIDGYKEAESINRRLGNLPWLAKNLNNRGLVHMDLEQFDEAVQSFRESEEICTLIGSDRGRAYALNNWGRVLGRMGNHERALELISEAEVINRRTENWEELAENLGNRGRLLFDQGSLIEADSALCASLEMYEEGDVRNLYRFEFTVIRALVLKALGPQTEWETLAATAIQLADELDLAEQDQSTWFVRLLPLVRNLTNSER